MQRETFALPGRLSLSRAFVYGLGLVLALIALMPLSHRLWPVSLLTVVGVPLVDRLTGRDRPRRSRARGEVPITARLADLEGDGYRILRHVEAGRNRIDQVIVGPTGVFVIRVNSWPGRFSIRRDGWFQHTKRDAGELVWDVAQEVMAVRARLKSKGLIGQVQGLVAVTRSTMPEPVIHMGRVTFVDGRDLIAYLTSRRPSLTPEEITEAATGLPA